MEGVTVATVTALAVLFLVLVGCYLSWRATRLDRLHRRVETSRLALDAALLQRGAAVLDLAAADALEPSRARELAEAATAVRRADLQHREMAESELSRVLRASLDSVQYSQALRPHLEEVGAAAKRVHMARTFHNDAVSDTRRARRSRLVRALRLAGTAPLPDFFEIDDQPPRTIPPSGGPHIR